VVGEARAAEPTLSAGDVRSGNNPIPRTERRSVARTDLAPGLDDDADVLVPADQRVLEPPFVRRPRVLDRLAAKPVLVRPADPRVRHVKGPAPRPRARPRERPPLDPPGLRHAGGAAARHRVRRRRRTSRSYSRRDSRTASTSATSATGTSHHVS